MGRYEKIAQARAELRKDELTKQTATSSKIQVPNVNATKQAYASAKEIAKTVGTDKIFKADLNYYQEIHWSDGTDVDRGQSTICLYAKDIDDANRRLKLLVDCSITNAYSFSDVKEISYDDAQQIISKNSERKFGLYFKDLDDHILTLPTPAMYDEMKKSIDWAFNMLKKLKDQDEAKKRAAWLQTLDGKAWLEKYEADKALLDKLEKQEQAAQDRLKAKQQQQAQNEDDVIDILRKQPKNYPQYKDGIAPVVVEGGRKFKGKGFAISWEDCSGADTYVPMFVHGHVAHDYAYYHRDDEWTNAIIYDPTTKKIQKANIKFCKVDPTVTNDQCVEAFKQYCEDKVKSTIDWCRSKDPKKSDFQINSWAKNIIKKYHPWIDIDKYIKFDKEDVENAESAKVASTIDWAISLGKKQTETERIIMKALAKKGLDYSKFKELISLKINVAFGKEPKVMTFS